MKNIKKHILLFLLASMACAARAEDLGKARLLVATPELQGLYSHTALLAVPMQGQHIGFILNRATELKMGALSPEHAPSAKVVDPIYFGGPEMVGAIFAVVRSNPGEASLPLFDDLFVTAAAQTVDRIIEQTPNDARYFVGFVGWKPGELDKEIEAGYWYVTDADATLVFSDDTGAMWEDLVKRLGPGQELRKNMRQIRFEEALR
jgi:putative transcriptional regulator